MGNWINIESTSIGKIRNVGEDLHVFFKTTGHIYCYKQAGIEIQNIMKAVENGGSIGSYINKEITKKYGKAELVSQSEPEYSEKFG